MSDSTRKPPRKPTRAERAAQHLLDYCASDGQWSRSPSPHVIEALRVLTGKREVPDAH